MKHVPVVSHCLADVQTVSDQCPVVNFGFLSQPCNLYQSNRVDFLFLFLFFLNSASVLNRY